MNLLTKGIWTIAILTALVAGISLLPDGSQYPLPPEIAISLYKLYGYMSAANDIIPIDTLMQLVVLQTVLWIAIRVVWPTILKIIEWLRGTS